MKDEKQPLSDLLSSAEENISKKQKDFTMIQSYELVYKRFIDLASSNHECPVCERNFEKDHELEEFVANVKLSNTCFSFFLKFKLNSYKKLLPMFLLV